MTTGTELAHVGEYSIAERARGAFDVGQIDLIKDQVMPEDTTDGELAMFLETCIRHDFDPFINEIWAIKLRSGNRKRVVPVVAVDGLRKKANQSEDFRGCTSNVIHEHDFFDFEYSEREDETVKVVVQHKPRNESGEPTHGGPDGELRGPIVGAWARVRRKGHDDVFFIAYSKEYNKGEAVWKSHPHAMHKKAAESVTLRSAFNIAGVLGEGEAGGERRTLTESGAGSPEIEWPQDDELTEALQQRFSALGFTRARVRLAVNGRSEEELREQLVTMDAELDARAESEPVTDAEVVGNGDEAEPQAA